MLVLIKQWVLMKRWEREKSDLEMNLEECRGILEGLAKGTFQMYEFSDELEFAIRDVDEVLEHISWYEMMASKKSSTPMKLKGDK